MKSGAIHPLDDIRLDLKHVLLKIFEIKSVYDQNMFNKIKCGQMNYSQTIDLLKDANT